MIPAQSFYDEVTILWDAKFKDGLDLAYVGDGVVIGYFNNAFGAPEYDAECGITFAAWLALFGAIKDRWDEFLEGISDALQVGINQTIQARQAGFESGH